MSLVNTPVRPERMRAIIRRLVVDKQGCWLWQGAQNPACYGVAGLGPPHSDRAGLVHRITYRYFVGDLIAGMHIDHLCKITLCCNPFHLEQVTPGENTLRSSAQAAVRAKWQNRTHCSQGHALTPDNVVYGRRKHYTTRSCRTCVGASRLRRAARRRAAA